METWDPQRESGEEVPAVREKGAALGDCVQAAV